MAQAIRAVERGFFDVIMMTETKIKSEAYSHNRLGYDVTCSMAHPSSAGGDQSGLRMVMRERLIDQGIESMLYHGPNVVSCEIFTGLTRTPLVGAYLPPSTLEQIPEIEDDLQRFREPIVLGDLNVDLNGARSLHSQRVSDLLAESNIIDLV